MLHCSVRINFIVCFVVGLASLNKVFCQQNGSGLSDYDRLYRFINHEEVRNIHRDTYKTWLAYISEQRYSPEQAHSIIDQSLDIVFLSGVVSASFYAIDHLQGDQSIRQRRKQKHDALLEKLKDTQRQLRDRADRNKNLVQALLQDVSSGLTNPNHYDQQHATFMNSIIPRVNQNINDLMRRIDHTEQRLAALTRMQRGFARRIFFKRTGISGFLSTVMVTAYTELSTDAKSGYPLFEEQKYEQDQNLTLFNNIKIDRFISIDENHSYREYQSLFLLLQLQQYLMQAKNDNFVLELLSGAVDMTTLDIESLISLKILDSIMDKYGNPTVDFLTSANSLLLKLEQSICG
ncbi:MAG TPA: hypothetical protein PKC21_03370 [Oligoflexia bacterium]|nr:hypothetical protein [Oligoflexia bacterium]HMR24375.1 hypothetical protein [Oligoflexia bacterium]